MPPEEDVGALLSEIIATIKIPPPKREELKAMFRGIVVRRFKEGFIDEAKLKGELTMLGYGGDELERIVEAARLEYDLDYKSDLVTLFKAAFAKGEISADELYTRLTQIPMVPERAAAVLAIEELRKKPKPKPPK